MWLDRVKSIANLGSILDAAWLKVASDARAGVRHLHAAMQDVREFHHNGPLGDRLNGSLLELARIREEVDALYRRLDTLYSGN